ncbi:transaldolase [Agrobacterium larrymoorei]|uniref:Transaldolase n=1 Tax=Agrobacterium larrymoorei TaxID=160699 RepID=A0A4D7DRJ3_9HYPH|nr:transaldolase [Agrobacterium larrymoorei]QCI96912.1 transaldolase [Agrobacterium larrymoorei]QYA07661.1 transaldolase [Agrobacterium larrymoorei]WHA41551.1 transaldolase [Agrobacterium larrymoorei]
MTSKLDQLRAITTVVADTGDIDAVARLKPVDCTTNPSIVLKALGTPAFADTVKEAVSWGRKQGGSSDGVIAAVADRLAISVGAALVGLVPGRVSTEVDADLSFDTQASIAKAHAIIAAYKERGIERERILIKLASTWEGIKAAEVLQSEGIDCNLTLLFSQAQAIACAEAKAFLISPFVGRILDWYKKSTGENYTAETDPGVLSVREIYNYYKANGISTVVMGASFRNVGEIEALAGCDRLTISPALLEELDKDNGTLERKLSADNAKAAPLQSLDEKAFRWQLNEDAMATEKLSEGIRLFAKDLVALREIVRKELASAAA